MGNLMGCLAEREANRERGHTYWVRCVAKLTDTTFVSGSGDKTLKLWNKENGSVIRTFRGHTSDVRCVAKLTDTTFVSGSNDHTLILWNTEDGSVIRTFQEHALYVGCVAKLTDTTFVSGSSDNTLKFWNTEERLFWFYLLRDRLPLPEHLVFELTQHLKENEFIMTYK